MSLAFRRGLSTLIPPKSVRGRLLSSAHARDRAWMAQKGRNAKDGRVDEPNQAIGAAKDAARISRITSFYEKLPRGQAPVEKPTNPLDAYRVRHFGDKPSAWPIYHAIIFLVGIGYAQAYYFHLRHHKNHAH